MNRLLFHDQGSGDEGEGGAEPIRWRRSNSGRPRARTYRGPAIVAAIDDIVDQRSRCVRTFVRGGLAPGVEVIDVLGDCIAEVRQVVASKFENVLRVALGPLVEGDRVTMDDYDYIIGRVIKESRIVSDTHLGALSSVCEAAIQESKVSSTPSFSSF